MTAVAVRHLLALVLALLLVFGLRMQDRDIQWAIGTVDDRLMTKYTPYFPGLATLGQHEIFSPANAHRKKILILGASSVDSIGCDYTWHKPTPGVEPNVHYSCSVTGQLNKILADEGLPDWRAFNLARNGTKLLPMLYIYARLDVLKPEIVVMGEAFNYYMWENADANMLNAAQFQSLEAAYGSDPATADTWRHLRDHLERHGLAPQAPVPAEVPIPTGVVPRASTSISEVLVRLLGLLRTTKIVDAQPRPVAYDPTYRDWHLPTYTPHEFSNPDPDFGYFQGFTLIGEKQKEHRGHYFVYFCPQWSLQWDKAYAEGIRRVFGGYLSDHGVAWNSYVDVGMQPILETYDGSHQTIAGNRKIAQLIFTDLKRRGFFDGDSR